MYFWYTFEISDFHDCFQRGIEKTLVVLIKTTRITLRYYSEATQ